MDIKYLIKNLIFSKMNKKVLLWTNTSDSYGANTVQIDFSQFDEIEVWGDAWGGGTSEFCTRVPVGHTGALSFVTYSMQNTSNPSTFLNAAMRNFSTTQSSITFENGQMLYNGSVYLNWSNRAIPRRIYGIKN